MNKTKVIHDVELAILKYINEIKEREQRQDTLDEDGKVINAVSIYWITKMLAELQCVLINIMGE